MATVIITLPALAFAPIRRRPADAAASIDGDANFGLSEYKRPRIPFFFMSPAATIRPAARNSSFGVDLVLGWAFPRGNKTGPACLDGSPKMVRPRRSRGAQ